MSAYGLNMNASMVRSKDGKYSCGLKLDDSTGLNVSKELSGDSLSDIMDSLLDDVMIDMCKHQVKLDDATEKEFDEDDFVSTEEYEELIRENDALVDRIDELEDKIAKYEAEHKKCSCNGDKKPVENTSHWKSIGNKKNNELTLDDIFEDTDYMNLLKTIFKL